MEKSLKTVRLIDADALMNAIMNDCAPFTVSMVYRHIANAPTIDVEPVKYGVWIPDDYEYNHCSECGFEHDEPEYVTQYCPNCGAKMGGD